MIDQGERLDRITRATTVHLIQLWDSLCRLADLGELESTSPPTFLVVRDEMRRRGFPANHPALKDD